MSQPELGRVLEQVLASQWVLGRVSASELAPELESESVRVLASVWVPGPVSVLASGSAPGLAQASVSAQVSAREWASGRVLVSQ